MSDVTLSPLPPALRHWRGLGLWNFYFIAKLVLFWQGLINFHPLYNLALAAWLLFPLAAQWLHRLRQLLALPFAIALLYYDTWLPPFSRLLAQSSAVETFSADYMLELAGRFINWNWLAGGLTLLVVYLFLSQFIRFSLLIFSTLAVLTLWPYLQPWWSAEKPQLQAQAEQVSRGVDKAVNRADSDIRSVEQGAEQSLAATGAPPSDEVLNRTLSEFYQQQSQQFTNFPAAETLQAPFDVLILNICSLSWSDMQAVGLMEHPLWQSMDVVFDEFNSASTYSGPAMIRLLRASCGQQTNADLFAQADPRCYLFDNLKKIGFSEAWAMNHDGHFGDFVAEARKFGGLATEPMSLTNMSPVMTSFDGSPIYRDLTVLDNWWQQRLQSDKPREVLYYNTITLHDGNRTIDNRGQTSRADYKQNLTRLFDDLQAFIQKLEQSGRPLMVVIVPEHGAALTGDLMQISGMREIPSPSIVHVPVGVKLVNAKSRVSQSPMHVTQPSSYLAISQLVADLANGQAFSQDNVDVRALVQALPQTVPVVAANEGSVMLRYQGKEYLTLDRKTWTLYPQQPSR